MGTTEPILAPEQVWRAYDEAEQRLTANVSERKLDLAGLRAGDRVLDLATGRGEPAVRAARRVGPTGKVVGVDLSASMLEFARERAQREGVANLDLQVMNAESLDGVGAFDAVLARWCLMYFDGPVAALSAARRALMPGGVLVAAVWAEPERVPYYSLPRRILERYVALPPVDMEAPGTFHYADPARLRSDFAAAGLVIDHIEELETAVMEARTGAELVAWTRAFGMTRLLNDLPDEVQRAWEADMGREDKKHKRGTSAVTPPAYTPALAPTSPARVGLGLDPRRFSRRLHGTAPGPARLPAFTPVNPPLRSPVYAAPSPTGGPAAFWRPWRMRVQQGGGGHGGVVLAVGDEPR